MGSHYRYTVRSIRSLRATVPRVYARYAPQFHELAGGRASDEKQSVCMPSLLAHHEHPLTPLHVPLSYEVSQVGGGGGGLGPSSSCTRRELGVNGCASVSMMLPACILRVVAQAVKEEV